MSVVILLPPPQTLDSLNAWGPLDSLPWSLDAAIWETAVIYGLTTGTEAEVQEALAGEVRIRVLAPAPAPAGSGGGLAPFCTRQLSAAGSAATAEEILGGISVSIPLDPAEAGSGETLLPERIRQDAADAQVLSGETLSPNRVRSEKHASGSVSGTFAMLFRVRLAEGMAHVAGSAAITPEYKGWNWIRRESGVVLWQEVVEWQ